MSAPNDTGYGQYPPQPYGEPQYPEQPAQGYGAASSPPPQTGAHPDHGRKKKRAYAAGAFDVAAGGNAAVGGQLPGGGQFCGPQPYGAPQTATPAYGGYSQPDAQPAAYGAQPVPYGAPQPGAPGVGSYQAPDTYYPSAGAAAPVGGVAGITTGLSSMQLGAGAQQPQQLPPQARAGPLNQLFPTDLLSQPFNVSELDLPPPPIILPPNVSYTRPTS